MSKIGFRECHFIKVSNIDALIEELKASSADWRVPPDYDLKIYKSVYACCGTSNSNIVVEITGPEEKEIKNIDLRFMAKLMEICQQRGYEYHACEPMEVA